jgi:hypothetical protein
MLLPIEIEAHWCAEVAPPPPLFLDIGRGQGEGWPEISAMPRLHL